MNPSSSAPELAEVLQKFSAGDQPIGFRFRPSDEQLLSYLQFKLASGIVPAELIGEIHADSFFNIHPKDLVMNPSKEKEECPEDTEWYFFIDGDEYFKGEIAKDRKVGEGIGSWRSVGKEDAINNEQGKVLGYKYLSTYFSAAGHSARPKQTLWEMQKYRLNTNQDGVVTECVAARITRRNNRTGF